MLLAYRQGGCLGIASGLTVLFLHIVVSVSLFVSCQIIKMKFGELEGYDTSMSMEHIYIIYNVVQYIVYSIFISRET